MNMIDMMKFKSYDDYRKLEYEELEELAYGGDADAQYCFAETLYAKRKDEGKIICQNVDGKMVDLADYVADVASSNGVIMAYALKLENRIKNNKYNNGSPVQYDKLSMEQLKILADLGDDGAPFELATRYYYNHLNSINVVTSSTTEICTQPTIEVNGEHVGAIRYWIDKALEAGNPLTGLLIAETNYYYGMEDLGCGSVYQLTPRSMIIRALNMLSQNNPDYNAAIPLMSIASKRDTYSLDCYACYYDGAETLLSEAYEAGYINSTVKLMKIEYDKVISNTCNDIEKTKLDLYEHINFVINYVPRTKPKPAGTDTYDPRDYENKVLERCKFSFRTTGRDSEVDNDTKKLAYVYLSKCFANGWGCKKDLKNAVENLLKATALGYSGNDVYELNELLDKINKGKALTDEEKNITSSLDLAPLLAKRAQNSGCALYVISAAIIAIFPILCDIISNIVK